LLMSTGDPLLVEPTTPPPEAPPES